MLMTQVWVMANNPWINGALYRDVEMQNSVNS